MKKFALLFSVVCALAMFCTGCFKGNLPLSASVVEVNTPRPTVAVTPGTTTGTTPGVTPSATPVVTPVVTHIYYVTITGSSAGNVDACVSKWSGTYPGFTQQTYYMDPINSFVWTSTTIVVDPATETFHMEGVCASQQVQISIYKDSVLFDQWTATAGNAFSANY